MFPRSIFALGIYLQNGHSRTHGTRKMTCTKIYRMKRCPRRTSPYGRRWLRSWSTFRTTNPLLSCLLSRNRPAVASSAKQRCTFLRFGPTLHLCTLRASTDAMASGRSACIIFSVKQVSSGFIDWIATVFTKTGASTSCVFFDSSISRWPASASPVPGQATSWIAIPACATEASRCSSWP